MAWPKGKSRLSEEERERRAEAAESAGNYPYLIRYRHGDGAHYGCGQFVTSYLLGDEAETAKANEIMTEHKKTCYAKDEKKRG